MSVKDICRLSLFKQEYEDAEFAMNAIDLTQLQNRQIGRGRSSACKAAHIIQCQTHVVCLTCNRYLFLGINFVRNYYFHIEFKTIVWWDKLTSVFKALSTQSHGSIAVGIHQNVDILTCLSKSLECKNNFTLPFYVNF